MVTIQHEPDAPSHLFHLTAISENAKTGRLPVWSTSRSTCPPCCPLRGKCYGEAHPICHHFNRVSDGRTGVPLETILRQLAALSCDRSRGLDVGDLPGNAGRLDRRACLLLAAALRGVRWPWAFSHYPLTSGNLATMRAMRALGLVVNASVHNLADADRAADVGMPVACTSPRGGIPRGMRTPAGRRCVQCPASLSDGVTCATCGGRNGPLCARADRDCVVILPAHGSGAKHVEALW